MLGISLNCLLLRLRVTQNAREDSNLRPREILVVIVKEMLNQNKH